MVLLSHIGKIGVWSPDTDASVREGNAHHCPVTLLQWSPTGNRLISGDKVSSFDDKDGDVIVWKVDSRGKLSLMSRYRVRAPVLQILFKNSQHKSRESRTRRDECPPFFIANCRGEIFYADDAGHCSECVQISPEVAALTLDEASDGLYILGDDMTLTHYVQNSDGKLMMDPNDPQIKIGSIFEGNGRITQWIDGNSLVYGGADGSFRVWDNTHGESLILEPPESLSNSTKSICFSKRNEILSILTASGQVRFWYRNSGSTQAAWDVSCSHIA
jgi:intraflagellar transport protein 140